MVEVDLLRTFKSPNANRSSYDFNSRAVKLNLKIPDTSSPRIDLEENNHHLDSAQRLISQTHEINDRINDIR